MKIDLGAISQRRRVRIVKASLALITVGITVPTLVLPERAPLAAREPLAGEETVPAQVAAANAPSAVQSETVAAGNSAPAVAAETVGLGSSVAESNDLTRETYTATGDLSAKLVSPGNGMAADGSSAKIVVATAIGAGVEMSVNGSVVARSRIGERAVDKKQNETRYAYYGIPLHEGPNDIALVPLGADGVRGAPAIAVVYGPGKAVTLKAALEGPMIADGKTPSTLVVQAYDVWHHPAQAGVGVKIAVLAGDLRFDSNAASTPVKTPPQTTQLPPAPGANGATSTQGHVVREAVLEPGGTIKLPVFPGVSAGRVELQIDTGDLEEHVSGYLQPFLHKPFVNGLVSAGTANVPGLHGESTSTFDVNDGRRGRVAIFGTGVMGKTTSATLAYDSANDLMQHRTSGAFIDNPDQRPYLTYGDASSRRADALSRNHLYARFEDGRRSLTYGQIEADTMGAQAVGGYHETVQGVKLEAGGPALHGVLFNARSDVAYARETFNPSGLSLAAQILHPDIVVGSETVTLVALDRHTGAPVAQTVLSRNVDYTVDYTGGSLRFITIPLPFDDRFNPQAVLVQYQYNGPHVAAQKNGGRVDLALGAQKSLRLGLGYVNSVSGAGNYSLAEQDVSGLLPSGSWSVSHATSTGLAQVTSGASSLSAGAGAALRVKLSTRLFGTRFEGSYDSTTTGFSNPFGGLSAPGLTNYHGAITRGDPRSGEIGFTFDGAVNHGGAVTSGISTVTSSQFSAGFKMRKRVSDRMTFTAQLDSRHQHDGSSSYTPALAGPSSSSLSAAAPATPATSSTQLQLGMDYRASSRLAFNLARVENVGGGALSSQPAQTSAQLNYDLGGKGKFFVRQLWSGTPTQSFASSTASLTGAANATSSTTFGFERALGNNTSLDSQYVVDRGGNGTDVYAAMGVKERFAFGRSLRGDLTLQRANATGNGQSGFTLVGASLSYASSSRLRATASLQERTGEGRGLTGTLGIAGRLSSELSVLGAYNMSHTIGVSSTEARLGIAWRPTENDRGATLLGFVRSSGLTASNGATNVLSLEHDERLTARLEFTGRLAYKLDGDSYYAARTSLVGIGLTQKIGSRLDIGAEERVAAVRNVGGAQATNFATEAGYRVADRMRLAVGYNFHGSADPTLAGTPVRRGIYATVTSIVDRIFGWGKAR